MKIKNTESILFLLRHLYGNMSDEEGFREFLKVNGLLEIERPTKRGQKVNTPKGPGFVISIREKSFSTSIKLANVRLDATGEEEDFFLEQCQLIS